MKQQNRDCHILSVSCKMINEDGILSMKNLFPIDICDAYVQETRLKILSIKRRYISKRNYVTDDITYIRKQTNCCTKVCL